jgi:thiol-disulfide isomerase/thioredoxin
MDTTPLPPQDPQSDLPSNPSSVEQSTAPPRAGRRSWPILLAIGVVTVALAISVVLAFVGRGGSDSTNSDVVQLDPNATQPFNGLDDGVDLVGQQLPSLNYTTFGGETLELATVSKPLIINFWSSTCAPCIKEMPAIQQVWTEWGDRVDFIGLDYVEVASAGQAMIDRTGITYPVGRDPRGTLLRTLGGNGLPYTVAVNRDGKIIAAHSGELTKDSLQAMVDEAFRSGTGS